jgi:hypothetical protein
LIEGPTQTSPSVGLDLADDGLQQDALAGPVRADEADALAVHDRELEIRQHDVVAEPHPGVP